MLEALMLIIATEGDVMPFDPVEDGVRKIAEISRHYAGQDCPVVRFEARSSYGFSKYEFFCVKDGEKGQSFFATREDRSEISKLLERIWIATRDRDRGGGVVVSVDAELAGQGSFSVTFPLESEV
ncbi:hypothetical protein [Porphyrobacter sp. ULC335]|uniref:hypothetical protein n=1 Tax=Porphyrobacter sp. ULC335 TaxID=2854260 RepID=UPI00221ECD41|nr:hypothetical protein [Porphyrobacter sp. ULC335]UYV14260.1 hypothetical protein KVF90_08670 [Porphyrobacter sp. ULC335]